jgi:hydrogenase expression/formation protein HypC
MVRLAIIPFGDLPMCLAAPARVISVSDKTAVVDYQGVRTTARLDTLAEPVAVGDYVLVHTGFAIQRLTAEDAEETLRLFDELAQSVAEDDATRSGA